MEQTKENQRNYRTTEIANLIGIHPNTVRLYEANGLITMPQREKNGYRIFTDLHVAEFKVARLAFQVEILQNGLRKEAIEIVKVMAKEDFDQAIQLTEAYMKHIEVEEEKAEEALKITREILSGAKSDEERQSFTRKEMANILNVTIDTLRNWEMNGLITIKRKVNGYRMYTIEDMKRLKIIRELRCANYSLEAILRMLNALSNNPKANIRKVIDTPCIGDQGEIISCCDQLLFSLEKAKTNARRIKALLHEMKDQFGK